MHELTTERLLLRRFEASDVDFVFDLYSRWEVQRYIGRIPRPMVHRSEAIERVARNAAFDDDPRGIWLIAGHDGVRHGTLLLKTLPASGGRPSTETEIGWHLHPDAWGRGIATEAARRVLGHAFAAGLGHLLAVTHPDNAASQAVARRIGMRDQGLTDAYYDTTCLLFRVDRPTDAVGHSSDADPSRRRP